jgi:hypothetical protein
MSFEVLTIIVVLNALATIALWRKAAHRPEKLKKTFLKQLLHSEPITPKHEPPPPLKKDAWGVDEEVLQFFDDFRDFANVVNWWLADDPVGSPWRLQELLDARLKLGFRDSPNYGRRYAIFHNQVRLGTLEVHDYFYDTSPRVIAEIEIEDVRLLSFDSVRDFLVAIARHTCDRALDSKEYIDAQQAIDRAMIAVLWQAVRVSEFDLDEDYGQIDLRLEGSAEWYFRRREAPAFNAAVTAHDQARTPP